MCSVMPKAASFMEFSMGPISIKPIWPIKALARYLFLFYSHDTRKIPARYHGQKRKKQQIPKCEKHETIYFIFPKCPAFAEEKFPGSKLPSNYATKISLLLYNLPAHVSDAWQLQGKPR